MTKRKGVRRVDVVGEYNINSRNFANERKLGRAIIVRPSSSQKQQLTRCPQTSYIVLLIFDRLPDCHLSLSRHRAKQKRPVLPSVLLRESRRQSTSACVVVRETHDLD